MSADEQICTACKKYVFSVTVNGAGECSDCVEEAHESDRD
jgi:hypothetical protein